VPLASWNEERERERERDKGISNGIGWEGISVPLSGTELNQGEDCMS
jgi:hypothetical protein